MASLYVFHFELEVDVDDLRQLCVHLGLRRQILLQLVLLLESTHTHTAYKHGANKHSATTVD